MPVLAKLKGLVVRMCREITQACCPDYFRENYPQVKLSATISHITHQN